MTGQSCPPCGIADGAESTTDATGFCHKYWFVIALLTITLVGAALRVVHLDSTIGIDEANEMRAVMCGGFRRVFHTLTDEEAVARGASWYSRVVAANYHRLNAILAVLSAKVFGSSMWAWRLPSYLFGVGLIPLIALFVKRAFQNRRAALLAAALVTFSFPLFSYSSANRGFATLTFFAVAACFSLLKVLGSPTILNLVLLVFTTFCLGISHMFAVILLGALGCYLALHIVISLSSKTLKAHAAILALAALLVGVLLTAWLYSRNIDLVHAVWERITTGSFPKESHWPMNIRYSVPIAKWLVTMQHSNFRCQPRFVPIYWFLIIAGAPAVLRRYRRAGWLIICGVFFPLAVCCALHLTPSEHRVRYVLFMLPLMLVLIASFIDFIAGAVGSAMAKIAGRNLAWCSAAASVILLAAICGPGAQTVFRELRRPGLRKLAVYWDCKGAADYLGNYIRNEDVVLAFPLDSKKFKTAGLSLRLFKDSIRPHLFWDIYPKITEMPQPVTVSSVWYVTPQRDAFEQDFLPSTVAPKLEAEFQNCFVYRYLVETRNMRQVPLPAFDFGKRRSAEWQLSHLNRRAAKATVHAAQESTLNTRSVSVEMQDEGVCARAENSHLIAVMPGRVVHLGTHVAVDQRQEVRPHFVLSLRFFDETGKPILGSHGTRPRPGYCDLNLAPSEEWYPCRVSTVVPRGAHYMKVRMDLGSVFSSSAGDVIHIREPSLLVDWSESEILATVFRDFDAMPLPDDMSDFEVLTIENAGFRTEDGKVSGWYQHLDSGKLAFEADEVEDVEDSRFIRALVREDGTDWALYSQPVQVSPGANVRLIADVGGPSSSTAVAMQFLNAEGEAVPYAPYVSGAVAALTPSWCRIKLDSVAPIGASRLSVGLRITGENQAGDEYFFRPVSLWLKK